MAPEKTEGGWNCYLERTAGSRGGGGGLAAPSPEGMAALLLLPFSSLCADRCTASCLFPRYAEMCRTPPRNRAWPGPPRSFPPAPPNQGQFLTYDPKISLSPLELLVSGVDLPFGAQLPLPYDPVRPDVATVGDSGSQSL